MWGNHRLTLSLCFSASAIVSVVRVGTDFFVLCCTVRWCLWTSSIHCPLIFRSVVLAIYTVGDSAQFSSLTMMSLHVSNLPFKYGIGFHQVTFSCLSHVLSAKSTWHFQGPKAPVDSFVLVYCDGSQIIISHTEQYHIHRHADISLILFLQCHTVSIEGASKNWFMFTTLEKQSPHRKRQYIL